MLHHCINTRHANTDLGGNVWTVPPTHFLSWREQKDRPSQMLSVCAPMCLYDIKSDSSPSNKCPCFNINLLSWQLWDIISQIEISQPYLKTWWRPSYWRHDWLSGLLPGEADCSLNNMISLNAAPIPRPAKPTEAFHLVVMTGLSADEREQRALETHKPWNSAACMSNLEQAQRGGMNVLDRNVRETADEQGFELQF